MDEKLVKKLTLLNTLLKDRKNESYLFFDKIIVEILEGSIENAARAIVTSYSIVQYADFNYKEEIIFEEIWNMCNEISSSN